MPLLRPKLFWPVIIVAGILFAGAASAAGFLWGVYYKHWDTPFVAKVADVTPLPAARIGARTILYRNYLRDVRSVERYLSSDEAKSINVSRPMTDDDRKNALERLLREAALDELAEARNVTVSEAQMQEAMQTLNLTSTTTKEFEDLIAKNFGWTMEDFKTHVVRPSLLTNVMTSSYAVDHGNDPKALEKYLDERMQEKDVVST